MMAPCLLFLCVGISLICGIYSQIVTCQGDCSCPSTAPQPGATCILDCGSIDACKGHTLTCRANDPCEIHCDGKASCSSDTTIRAKFATDVSIICGAEDSCKDSISIVCGTGHCYLECDESTSCEDWGALDLSSSISFACVGQCPSSVPAPYSLSVAPSLSPTVPTPRPTPTPSQSTANPTTAIPTNVPTHSPTLLPTTAIPTNVPTYSPTSLPTKRPTRSPTNKPTNVPTHRPTATTNAPTKRPTDIPTISTTSSTVSAYASVKPTSQPTKSELDATTITTYDVLQTETIYAAKTVSHHDSWSLPATSAAIIILSLLLCCAVMVTLWLYILHKREEGEPQVHNIAYKPTIASKSATSVISPTILSVGFNSNDTASPLSSVYKTCGKLPGDEGSSDDGASSSDDLYSKLAQNIENEVQSTGQSPVSVIQQHISGISMHSISSQVNQPYFYVPRQVFVTTPPYELSRHGSAYMPGHFPSISSQNSIPYMCYLPSPRSPHLQLAASGLPHIAGNDVANDNMLPSIPPASIRDEDEFSEATVTSGEKDHALEDVDENINGSVIINEVSEMKALIDVV